MADCSTAAAATDSMLSVRIGAAVGIFLVSSVGAMLPLLAMTARLEGVFFVLRAIGAGVVLATAFVHVFNGALSLLFLQIIPSSISAPSVCMPPALLCSCPEQLHACMTHTPMLQPR